jgi:hypothetical protein
LECAIIFIENNHKIKRERKIMDQNKFFFVYSIHGEDNHRNHEMTIYRETIEEAEQIAVELLSKGYYTKNYPMVIVGYDGSVLNSHS